MLKGDGLELCLGTVANQGHHSTVGACQGAGGQCGSGSGTHGGGQGQFTHQGRCASSDIGQHTKRHHSGQANGGVLGVAIDVFEAVGLAVRNGHQFNDTRGRVIGHADRFVKVLPAQEISLNVAGNALYAGLETVALHQLDGFRRAEVERVNSVGL